MNEETLTLIELKYGVFEVSNAYADRLPEQFFNEFYVTQLVENSILSQEMVEMMIEQTRRRVELLVDLQMYTNHASPGLCTRINKWLVEYEQRNTDTD